MYGKWAPRDHSGTLIRKKNLLQWRFKEVRGVRTMWGQLRKIACMAGSLPQENDSKARGTRISKPFGAQMNWWGVLEDDHGAVRVFFQVRLLYCFGSIFPCCVAILFLEMRLFKPWQLRAGSTDHVLGLFSSFLLRDYPCLRVDSPLHYWIILWNR